MAGNSVPYTRVQTADETLNRIQSSIVAGLGAVSQGPFQSQQGNLLSKVLVNTSQTQIAHKLGSVPNNVFLGCPTSNSVIYQSQTADDQFIYLTGSAQCFVSVWVS